MELEALRRWWFYEATLRGRVPLRFFGRDDSDLVFNLPRHGMKLDTVASFIWGLVDEGKAFFAVADSPVELSPERLVREMREKKRDRRDRCVLGMTSTGGAEWERFASPRWAVRLFRRFRMEDASFIYTERGVDESLFPSLMSRLRDSLGLCGIVDWTEPPRSIGSWQPTYWKRLPTGFEMDIRWPRSAGRRFVDQQGVFRGARWYRDLGEIVGSALPER